MISFSATLRWRQFTRERLAHLNVQQGSPVQCLQLHHLVGKTLLTCTFCRRLVCREVLTLLGEKMAEASEHVRVSLAHP